MPKKRSTRSSPQARCRHPREGIASQRAVNERAIKELVHRLVPHPTLPRVRCEHGLRPLNLCYGKKLDSEVNLGRWFSFVRLSFPCVSLTRLTIILHKVQTL